LRSWDMPHVAVAVGKHHLCDMQHPFMQSATWAMLSTQYNTERTRKQTGTRRAGCCGACRMQQTNVQALFSPAYALAVSAAPLLVVPDKVRIASPFVVAAVSPYDHHFTACTPTTGPCQPQCPC
jgi:hypothetical protein